MAVTEQTSKRTGMEEYYRRLDAMDVPGFLGLLAEDARLTLGNADPVVGRDTIAGAFGGLLGAIRSCRHVLDAVHDAGGDLAVVEGAMEFVRQDGEERSVRFANAVRIGTDGTIHEQRLYLDLSPLTT